MPEVRRPVAFLILGVLCAQFLVLGLIQASRDSVTVDEAIDLTAGLVAVENRDLRMLPEHALLLPLSGGVLAVIGTDPLVPSTEAYDDGDWFDYTDDLISANEETGRLDDVAFWFRVGPLLIALFAGLGIYALGSRLVDRVGGLLAAGIWLTTPYVLGLAHLSSLDVTFAATVVGCALAIDRYRCAPTRAQLLMLAAALGVALLARHTAIVLVPVVLGIAAIHGEERGLRARIARVALTSLLTLGTVWLAYRAVDPTSVGGIPGERFDALIASASAASPVQRLALAVPFPTEWRAGLAYLFETSQPRRAYLLGETWSGTRPWFFPVSALVKVPLIAALAIGGGAMLGLTARGAARRRALVVLGPASLVLGLFLLLQPLQLGLRMAVPALALLCIAAAGLARLPRPAAATVVVVLVVGQAAATVAAHPTSLAWTPPPFHDGYRWVTDSSIDFGQPLRAVQDEHREEPFVAASLFLPRGLDGLEGVPRVEDTTPARLVGRVAVSATVLLVREPEELSWLRAYCPVEVVAHAVLVYAFDEAPDTRPAAGMPEAPCHEELSHRRR